MAAIGEDLKKKQRANAGPVMEVTGRGLEKRRKGSGVELTVSGA